MLSSIKHPLYTKPKSLDSNFVVPRFDIKPESLKSYIHPNLRAPPARVAWQLMIRLPGLAVKTGSLDQLHCSL